MKASTEKKSSEFLRISRVSDMLCTMHSILKEKYSKLAFGLDVAIVFCSVWICATTFLNPDFGKEKIFFGLGLGTLLGLISVFVFFFTMLQFLINWRGLADSHAKAFDFYSEIKLECNNLKNKTRNDYNAQENVIEKYKKIGAVLIKIPDSQFVSLKRQHKLKVLKSRILDRNPGVLLPILHFVIIWKGTMRIFKDSNEELINGRK